jgi:hypothetical protein
MRLRLTTGLVMKGLAIAAFFAVTTLAQAAPPTVTPSPGYDRRLQESRSTTVSPPTTTMDVTASPPAVTHPHARKKHTH